MPESMNFAWQDGFQVGLCVGLAIGVIAVFSLLWLDWRDDRRSMAAQLNSNLKGLSDDNDHKK